MIPATINITAVELIGDYAFRIEYGELVWGNYDLCFPFADLYQNRLMPEAALEKAA